jgi:hypothetical protein
MQKRGSTMKIYLFLFTFLPLLSCTSKKSESMQNICEERIKPNLSDLANGKVTQSLMIQQAPPTVCQMRFQDGNNIQEAIFVLDEKVAKLIYKTPAHAIAECGMMGHKLKPELINLKFNEGSHTVVAIESLTMQVGCASSEEKKGSEVLLYDLTTQKISNTLKGSDIQSGIVAKYNWEGCAGTNVCEQVHFTKQDVPKNLKPLAFVLKWDDSLVIKEMAF